MFFFPSVFRPVNKISLIIALVRAQFIVKTVQGTLLSNKMDKWSAIVIRKICLIFWAVVDIPTSCPPTLNFELPVSGRVDLPRKFSLYLHFHTIYRFILHFLNETERSYKSLIKSGLFAFINSITAREQYMILKTRTHAYRQNCCLLNTPRARIAGKYFTTVVRKKQNPITPHMTWEETEDWRCAYAGQLTMHRKSGFCKD